MTYTTDEKGNTVMHIVTGRKGMEYFKELGFKNTMSKEELNEHLTSHNRRVQKENKMFFEQFEKIFGKLK